jgi:hypothetical protein
VHGPRFRAYTHDDLIGVQVGGAAKNVIAIATGIADGLGFGANTRAALITRGLAEVIRLGEALGARRETFMGLAGLGDLVLTCTDDQSRNRRLGLALAAGKSAAEAMAEIGAGGGGRRHGARGARHGRPPWRRDAHLLGGLRRAVRIPHPRRGHPEAVGARQQVRAGLSLLRRRPQRAAPPKSFCRHASNRTTATVLDRLRLRLSGRIGTRSLRSGGMSSSTAWGSPEVSEPNISASPGL